MISLILRLISFKTDGKLMHLFEVLILLMYHFPNIIIKLIAFIDGLKLIRIPKMISQKVKLKLVSRFPFIHWDTSFQKTLLSKHENKWCSMVSISLQYMYLLFCASFHVNNLSEQLSILFRILYLYLWKYGSLITLNVRLYILCHI